MHINKTYENLDILILSSVSASNGNPAYNRQVAEEGQRIAEATGRDDTRVIYGRVQVLQKAGKIQFLNKNDAPDGKAGWYLGR